MKLATFGFQGDVRWGVVIEEAIFDVCRTSDQLPTRLTATIARWSEFQPQIEAKLADAPRIPLADVQLLPPIPDPQKIFCVGRNYADHATEQGAEIPTEPVIFNKLPGTLIGHEEAIRIPELAKQVDYEGELVVVIGRSGRQIARKNAWDYVFGFACGNDVTARDWQKGRPGGQWLLGKTIDTFGPLGPWIVTADQFSNPPELGVRTRLNGQLMQDGNTSQFLFPIDQLISHLSQFCTLLPGDLLYTGTPEGVGIARNPPVLLKPGDEICVEIDQIGQLRNRVESLSPTE